MLQFVRYVLGKRHTLFLGFGHRDPEISRLIEDVIFEAENQTPPVALPGFYSLQFDMLQKTPEVFAARGIVALQPSLVLVPSTGVDTRACSLAEGLIDLLDNTEVRVDSALSLDSDLRRVASVVDGELATLLQQLGTRSADALSMLKNNDLGGAKRLTAKLVADLGDYSNQGVYLVDGKGRLVVSSCPTGLKNRDRSAMLTTVESRPYFRLAQSNRQAFVSAVFESYFNGNSTLAACQPLFDTDRFAGLLFSAFQLNDTGLVARLRNIPLPRGASLLVVDANGLLVLPPEREVSVHTPATKELRIPREKPDKNRGFQYSAVLEASRRDKRFDRLMQNVVPLSQDDDVQTLSPDLFSYFVVTELGSARWKVALARYLRIQQ
jgi:hypothetical protein